MLETGKRIWLVRNLESEREEAGAIRLTEAVVHQVISEDTFTTYHRGGGWKIGKNAFYTDAAAYGQALGGQAERLASMRGDIAQQIFDFNVLLAAGPFGGCIPGEWETQHFAYWEFLCPDCKRQHMQRRFIVRLEICRRIAGIPFVLGSGWRCKTRNTAVGGVEDSSHPLGWAGDIIATTSVEKFLINRAAMLAGFNRIGIAKYYVHLDSDPHKAANVLWPY